GGAALASYTGLSRRLWMFVEDSYRPGRDELRDLMRVATLNKLSLAFLRRARELFRREWLVEEGRYRLYMENAVEVVKALRGLDYALYKFRRPVDHVSVDLDILIRAGDVPEAVSRLRGLGFGVAVSEPYTVTLERRGFIVDLYTHPSFAWTIYMDGEKLLGEAEDVDVEGATARAITRDAEVAVAAAHAVYKEHMVLLIDCMTIDKWMSRRALELSRETKTIRSLLMAREACAEIRRGAREAPYRVSPLATAEILAEKLFADPRTRATALNVLGYIARRDFGRRLLGRVARKSY
ncbi:MAG: nucleotidyltransferase family protein, partial [Desulfurococcaceae archaeon]